MARTRRERQREAASPPRPIWTILWAFAFGIAAIDLVLEDVFPVALVLVASLYVLVASSYRIVDLLRRPVLT